MNRSERICREIVRLLGEALRSSYSAESVRITLTEAELSDDGRHATIFYSVVGDDAHKAAAKASFKAWGKDLRRYLSTHLQIKHLPSLYFSYDDSLERGSRVLEILSDLEDKDSDKK